MNKKLYETICYKINNSDFKWQSAISDIQTAFKQNPNGMNWNTFISKCIDKVIQYNWNRLTTDALNLTADALDMCIMAVGGYGRGLCVPYSDIDIVFLHTASGADREKYHTLVQTMVQRLWDMGFKVGQTLHTPDSLMTHAKTDIISRTALLTHRHIAGDVIVYNHFLSLMPKYHQPDDIMDFIGQKQAEKKQRHEKFGKTQYTLEPNIKQSSGTIRDLDTVYWICLYAFPHVKNFNQLALLFDGDIDYISDFHLCMRFFMQVRTCMHLISHKPSDILYFDMQQSVAKMLKYQDVAGVQGVEIFMGDYYRHVTQAEMTTNAILDAVIYHLKPTVHVPLPTAVAKRYPSLKDGVNLRGNMLYVYRPALFEKYPNNLVYLFEIAQKYGYENHPESLIHLQKIVQNTHINFNNTKHIHKAFLHILQGNRPDIILYYMNITGVLSCIVPEWKTIYCQMQYNMYHDYTTDTHTIRAIKQVYHIQNGVYASELPIVTQIARHIRQDPIRNRVLYMAVLLHDIAKGLGGDHSVLGADIACTVCQRMGLDDLSTDTVVWLVKYHLLLSHTADRRDISDIKTIQDFIKAVHGVHLLELLLVLTTADIRSVGQGIWTPWKHSLLIRVYKTASRHLLGENSMRNRTTLLPKIAQRLSHIKRADTIISHLSDAYLGATPDDIIDWHIGCMAHTTDWCLHMRPDKQNEHIRIMIFMPDRAGITAHITGVLSGLQINIIGAEVFTFYKLGILYSFRVQSVHGYTESILREKIKTSLQNPRPTKPRYTLLKSRNRSFDVPSQVIINNQVSYNATMIEIHAKDREGLLYTVCQTLTDLELNIRSARITSYGEWVCDVFYVRDKYGFKLHREHTKNHVQQQLYRALEKLEMT